MTKRFKSTGKKGFQRWTDRQTDRSLTSQLLYWIIGRFNKSSLYWGHWILWCVRMKSTNTILFLMAKYMLYADLVKIFTEQVLSVVSCLLSDVAVSCLLSGCQMWDSCCQMPAVRCLLSNACRHIPAVWWLLLYMSDSCCLLLAVSCLLSASCCQMPAVKCLLLHACRQMRIRERKLASILPFMCPISQACVKMGMTSTQPKRFWTSSQAKGTSGKSWETYCERTHNLISWELK